MVAVILRIGGVAGFICGCVFIWAAVRAQSTNSHAPLLRFGLWCCGLALVFGGPALFFEPTLIGGGGGAALLAMACGGGSGFASLLGMRTEPESPLDRPKA